MPRGQKSLEEKVQSEFPEFVETVMGLNVQELEKRLSDYAKNRHEVQESKKNDEALKEIASQKSEMEAPYRDALNAIELKSKYIIKLIEEKGGNV
jgi:hypothetical protein